MILWDHIFSTDIVSTNFLDEKKQYDPVGFRDSILEGLEVRCYSLQNWVGRN